MCKPYFVIVGRSASGKTGLMQQLCKDLQLRPTPHVTTRQPRDTDVEYSFVTKETFKQLPLLDSVEYCGNFYGIVKDVVDTTDIVIVEPHGVSSIREYLAAKGRPVYVVGISVSEHTAYGRMIMRDKVADEDRIMNDSILFSDERMNEVCDAVFQDYDMFRDYQSVLDYVKERCALC